MAERKTNELPKNEKAYSALRKIMIASVFGKITLKALADAKDGIIQVAVIWGVIACVKPGESQHGTYVRFIGQFRAMNLETGQCFKSPVCLLPRFIEEELAGGVTDSSGNVEFAVRIFAKLDEDAATKYVYMSEPIIEAKESEQLKALEAKMGSARLKLTAPK